MSTGLCAVMHWGWQVKAGMALFTRGLNVWVAGKLCHPSLTRATPEHLRDEYCSWSAVQIEKHLDSTFQERRSRAPNEGDREEKRRPRDSSQKGDDEQDQSREPSRGQPRDEPREQNNKEAPDKDAEQVDHVHVTVSASIRLRVVLQCNTILTLRTCT